jgi:hypothetical protein
LLLQPPLNVLFETPIAEFKLSMLQGKFQRLHTNAALQADVCLGDMRLTDLYTRASLFPVLVRPTTTGLSSDVPFFSVQFESLPAHVQVCI